MDLRLIHGSEARAGLGSSCSEGVRERAARVGAGKCNVWVSTARKVWYGGKRPKVTIGTRTEPHTDGKRENAAHANMEVLVGKELINADLL